MKTIIKLLLVIIVIANISCNKSTSTIAPASVLATSSLTPCQQYNACFQDTFVYHLKNIYDSRYDSMIVGSKIFYRFIGYGKPPTGYNIADTFLYRLEYVNLNLNIFDSTSRSYQYGCKYGVGSITCLKTKTNKQLFFSPVP